MDSKAYKYLISKIIEEYPNLSDKLPSEFYSICDLSSKSTPKTVSFFLSQLTLKAEKDSDCSLTKPEILNQKNSNLIFKLFHSVHCELALKFKDCNNTTITKSFHKHNGTQLLCFLSHIISPKWLPLFSKNDALDYAMCCFLIEAFMYVGWCTNAYENKAKRAAHLYFSHLRKSLSAVDNNSISVILGYLQSAWICAQKTEGIKDTFIESEKSDLIQKYSFLFHNTEKLDLKLFKLRQNQMFMILNTSPQQCLYSFQQIKNIDRTGLNIYDNNNNRIVPLKLIESIPIKRPQHIGMKHKYSCTTTNGIALSWAIIIQIFKNTFYRIDVLKSENQPCTISRIEFRIENKTQLDTITLDEYYGKGRPNASIHFLKNPFLLKYSSLEQNDISLFRSNKIELVSNESVESLVAWSYNDQRAIIDRTHLLGIFD